MPRAGDIHFRAVFFIQPLVVFGKELALRRQHAAQKWQPHQTAVDMAAQHQVCAPAGVAVQQQGIMCQQHRTAPAPAQVVFQVCRRIGLQIAELPVLVPVHPIRQVCACQIQRHTAGHFQGNGLVLQQPAAALRNGLPQLFPDRRRQIQLMVAHADPDQAYFGKCSQKRRNSVKVTHIP